MSEPSAYQPRVKNARARSLGDAVPVFRGFREDDVVKVEPKTNAELRAERDAARDMQPMIVRCDIDGCDWAHDGTFRAGRDAAIVHRTDAHPDLEAGVRRCQTPGCSRTAKPGLRKCGTCMFNDRLARATAGSKAARMGRETVEPPLEEATFRVLGVASSSSQLDTLAEIEPGPKTDDHALEAAAPLSGVTPPVSAQHPAAATPPGDISASTTTGKEPMKRTWTRETLIAALQDAARELGHTPTTADLSVRKLSSLQTKKFLVTHGFASYADLCKEAGLEPNTHGWVAPTRQTIEQPPAPTPAPASPVDDNGSLTALARELEDARADVNRANTRWLDAIRAFKAHDVIQQIGEDVAA